MNNMQFSQIHLISLFVGILVIRVCQSAPSLTQTIDDGAGHNITLNITHTQVDGEEEEVIAVSDANGDNMIEVDCFDGYYIEKPANSTDCLLTPKTEHVNESETCYNQTRHPGTNLTEAIAMECEGRDIIVQTPCDPDASMDVGNGTEPSAGRRKRNVYCYRYYYQTVRRVRYCCRRYYGVCVKICWRYIYVRVYYIKCY